MKVSPHVAIASSLSLHARDTTGAAYSRELHQAEFKYNFKYKINNFFMNSFRGLLSQLKLERNRWNDLFNSKERRKKNTAEPPMHVQLSIYIQLIVSCERECD